MFCSLGHFQVEVLTNQLQNSNAIGVFRNNYYRTFLPFNLQGTIARHTINSEVIILADTKRIKDVVSIDKGKKSVRDFSASPECNAKCLYARVTR